MANKHNTIQYYGGSLKKGAWTVYRFKEGLARKMGNVFLSRRGEEGGVDSPKTPRILQ